MTAICTSCRQPIVWKDGKWRHTSSPFFQRHHAHPLVAPLVESEKRALWGDR